MVMAGLVAVGAILLALIPYSSSYKVHYYVSDSFYDSSPSVTETIHISTNCGMPVTALFHHDLGHDYHVVSGPWPAPADKYVTYDKLSSSQIHDCSHRALPRVAIGGSILFLDLLVIVILLLVAIRTSWRRSPSSPSEHGVEDDRLLSQTAS
jgi:hypothetical protein